MTDPRRDPIALLIALTDADPCYYDHRGKCQAHSQGSDEFCAHGAARAYLTALDRTVTADNPTGINPTPHTEPHSPTPTQPHDDPTRTPCWYVVRITPGTWAQQIIGQHHLRGTADLHAATRQAFAWITRRHTYDVWASSVHITTRPDPAPLTPEWSNR